MAGFDCTPTLSGEPWAEREVGRGGEAREPLSAPTQRCAEAVSSPCLCAPGRCAPAERPPSAARPRRDAVPGPLSPAAKEFRTSNLFPDRSRSAPLCRGSLELLKFPRTLCVQRKAGAPDVARAAALWELARSGLLSMTTLTSGDLRSQGSALPGDKSRHAHAGGVAPTKHEWMSDGRASSGPALACDWGPRQSHRPALPKQEKGTTVCP